MYKTTLLFEMNYQTNTSRIVYCTRIRNTENKQQLDTTR